MAKWFRINKNRLAGKLKVHDSFAFNLRRRAKLQRLRRLTNSAYARAALADSADSFLSAFPSNREWLGILAGEIQEPGSRFDFFKIIGIIFCLWTLRARRLTQSQRFENVVMSAA